MRVLLNRKFLKAPRAIIINFLAENSSNLLIIALHDKRTLKNPIQLKFNCRLLPCTTIHFLKIMIVYIFSYRHLFIQQSTTRVLRNIMHDIIYMIFAYFWINHQFLFFSFLLLNVMFALHMKNLFSSLKKQSWLLDLSPDYKTYRFLLVILLCSFKTHHTHVI